MKLATSRKPHALIPTASMADIAFLLIIFFMVTTAHDVDRTSVKLPLSRNRLEAAKGAAVVVLSPDPRHGALVYKFSDGKRMSRVVSGPGDIFLEASRILYADPGRPFLVKADGSLRYAQVDEILDQLRAAGAQHLLLLTQSGKPGGMP